MCCKKKEKQRNNIPLLIWPCSVQPPPPPGPSTPFIPHQETNIKKKKSIRGPVLRRELGTAHIFLACAWERGHRTAPALLRGSQGLLQTHDGHLAAVSEPTAWAGRQAGEAAGTGRQQLVKLARGCVLHSFTCIVASRRAIFFFFFFFLEGKPPGPASVVLSGSPRFPELQMSLEFSGLSFSNVLP